MSWTQTRSRIALAKKADPAADVTELKRQLEVERLEEYIKAVVDKAPPLSPEQRQRLAALLPAGGRRAS